MRYLLSFFLFASFLALSIDGQTKRGRSKAPAKRKLPTLVTRTAQPPAIASSPLSVGLTVEKYVSNYELNSDGTGRQTWEMQQRCQTEVCIASAGTMRRVYNGDLEKIKLIDAYILKAGGTKVVLPPAAYSDKLTDQAEAAPGFSSLRELKIDFDGLEIGDASYFKFEILTVRSNFERRFDSLEIFPLVFDWKAIEINVSAPATYPLFVEGTGLEGGRLDDLGGRSRWQYRKQNVSKIDIEPMLHDITSVSPRFALTNFRSFEELGAVYWDGMKDKTVVTPAIKTLADEITKTAAEPSQQASLIYEWVNKNIRYLSIVLDRGGWVPHSATEIIANGYGDCKDYTTLIHTLLKAKGIESTPVLIRSDLSDWFPGVATANYFNHAVLYIPSIDMFADATMPNTRLGLVPQAIVGKKAVLAGERTGTIRVPDNEPTGNQVLSDVDIEFEANGSLKARTKNTYVGRSEIVFRPMFGDSSFLRHSTTFVKTLLAFFGVNGDGKVLSVGNPHKVGEPFSVDIEAKIGNFTTFVPKGSFTLPVGIGMVNMRALEGFATTETRKTNLIVGATTFRESFTVTLPPEVTPVVAPRDVRYSNATGSFRLTAEYKDGKIKVVRELVLFRDIIQPKDYPVFKEFIAKMLDVHDLEIEYTADPSLLRDKSKELRATAKNKNTRASAPADPYGDVHEYRSLKPAEVKRMEARVAANEKDVETRIALLRHYASGFKFRTGAVPKNPAIRHRLWLIRNRPDMGDEVIYGFRGPVYEPGSVEFRQLRDEWVARVAADARNTPVRLNAIEFVRWLDSETTEKLVRGGIETEPENYRFPLLMTEILSTEFHSRNIEQARRLEIAGKLLGFGKSALTMIKKERGDDRDTDRGELLKRMCDAAFEMGDLDDAAAYARELVLDFGQSAVDRDYDQAAHTGNTILGLVELRRNNIEKAKEHFMTSIRAPLRKSYNWLSRIETRLARELFERGERQLVSDYLKLCLDLGNLKEYPDSHADEIKALKLWQDQITKGAKPSFDFGAP